MRDLDDIAAEAGRWLAKLRPINGTVAAPTLVEALKRGPLDEDTLMEALDECTSASDTRGTRLVGHLLALCQDDRDTVAQALQAAP